MPAHRAFVDGDPPHPRRTRPRLRSANRRKRRVRSMGGVEAAKLARAGEKADIVALASKVMRDLEAEGHVARGAAGLRPVGDRARGRGWRAAARVENENAVRQAMTEARRLCYSTGPSGDHFKALCEKWGLADLRARQGPAGRAGGDTGGAGRRRPRHSAVERTDRPARRRNRRSAAAGDSAVTIFRLACRRHPPRARRRTLSWSIWLRLRRRAPYGATAWNRHERAAGPSRGAYGPLREDVKRRVRHERQVRKSRE